MRKTLITFGAVLMMLTFLLVPAGRAEAIEVTPPSNLAVTGYGAINFANRSAVEITGTTQPGYTVDVTVGTIAASTTAIADGTFSVQVDASTLIDGDVIITATATNLDGTASAPASITVVKDVILPYASVVYSTLATTRQDVIATLVPYEPVTVTNNNNSLTHTFTSNGTFVFEFVDQAGNPGTATATVANIDKVAPAMPTNLAVTGGFVNLSNVGGIEITCQAEPDTNLNLSVTGLFGITLGVPPTGSIAYSTPSLWHVPDGPIIITATSTDYAGNTGPTATLIVQKDTAAPIAGITYSDYDLTGDDVIATLVPSEGDTIVVTNNGGSFTYTFTENGSFTFEFKDMAGNPGTATATVTNIDKTPPPTPLSLAVTDGVINIANVGTIQVTGTAEAGLQVNVDVGGITATTTAAGDGSFQATVDGSTLSDGQISVSATAVNAIGNASAPLMITVTKDTVAPTAAVQYSQTGQTNQDVVATLDPSENVTITNNSGLATYTFTQNGSFTFEFVDAVGNTGSAVATVTNIDKVAPGAPANLAITGDHINLDNYQSVEVTGTAEAGSSVTIWVDEISTTVTAGLNGSFTGTLNLQSVLDGFLIIQATAADQAGNISLEAEIDATKDTVEPTGFIESYNPLPTNDNVTVRLHTSEQVTITNNGGSDLFTFTQNGSFTFEYEDLAGNYGSTEATVTNIDKDAPLVMFDVDTRDINLANVSAVQVTGNTEAGAAVTITAGSVVVSRTADSLGSFSASLNLTTLADGEIIISAAAIDQVGNEGLSDQVELFKDTVAPTAQVSYSTTDPTEGSVIATITPSEQITVTNNGGATTYTFTRNGSFTFEFEDFMGNTGSATATVTNITLPVPAAPTNLAVVGGYINQANVSAVVLTGSAEAGTQISVHIGGLTASTTAQADGSFQVTVDCSSRTDGTLGVSVTATNENGTSAPAYMSVWKDTVAPTATVAYSTTAPTNQDVLASIDPSESVTVTNNGGSQTYTFNQNGSFTFEFKDIAGNTGSAVATVSNIDRVAPTATVAYSTTDPTNQDVVATITPSEPVTVTNNNGELTHTFTANGSFTFEFVDAAGNIGSVLATVGNIDKVAPELVVSTPVDGQDIATRQTIVSGTVSEPATLRVTCNGVNYQTTTAGESNSYSLSINLRFSSTNTINVVAVDPAGNESAPASLEVNCTYQPPVAPPSSTHLPVITADEIGAQTATVGGETTVAMTVSSDLLLSASLSAGQDGVPVTLQLPPVDAGSAIHLSLTDSQLNYLTLTGLRIEGLGEATLELPAELVAAIAAANTGLTIESSGLSAEAAQAHLNPWDEVCFAQEIETAITGTTTLRWPVPELDNPEDLRIRVIHGDGSVEDLVPELVTINEQQYLQITVEQFSTFIAYLPGEQPVIPQVDKIVLTIGQQNIVVNGEIRLLDVAPFIDASANRTLVPLRFISEALGAEVQWLGASKQVRITDGDKEIVLTIGSKTVLVNGQSVPVDVAAQITGSRTFVPLRFIGELLGADVQWIPETSQIVITR